ncbi:hypothetical protein MCOR25_003318 [Pyricularia grisea]|uniref:Adenylate cyclase n=1 Tax=Pyricularia grisea TaxID=148305 RepID=A0A6P8B3R8_PYRGI|nr:hypothetical protein PgNI_06305 [Pyricularia grisea]KAI6373931.1 hypothetical protein MCOR25_003318 [Pyricularia grisea]TLD09918.1 hypothetical protein PgNI_06305 [Pyricularia grisea]
MTRNDALSRFSSITSSSTDSAHSTATVKPLPSTPIASDTRRHSGGSRPAIPSRLRIDDDLNRTASPLKDDPQVSPTNTFGTRVALSPSSPTSNVFPREQRLSDFGNYRRDLAVLDPGGSRVPQIQQPPPNTGPSLSSQVAPWMTTNGAGGAPAAIHTSFYNDSSDNLSVASQLSPGFRIPGGRPSISQPSGVGADNNEASYFGDERRPSIASITTTASSQGSKASGNRGGFRKLQGFFGEEFPGRDSSDTSLPPAVPGKEHRSHSYSHGRPYRDRNYSNATDHTRDGSPSSSRPRTPVPAPEVVPFLYQEADDIAKYGEAPVRDILSGPDRERYVTGDSLQNPPKTSSSSRSGHSLAHLSGHHRHQKSNDDPRTLRPTMSRDDSVVPTYKDRSGSATTMTSSRDRAHSPAPSGHSIGGYFSSKNGTYDGQTSPPGHQKKSLLGRFKRSKDKEDTTSLKKTSPSSTSLNLKTSRSEYGQSDGASSIGQDWPSRQAEPSQYSSTSNSASARPSQPRHGTFKSPFAKRGRTHHRHDDRDEAIGPTDKHDGMQAGGTMFHLDTDLNDMSGILSRPLPLTPMDADFVGTIKGEKSSVTSNGRNGAWDAPDSWAVKRTGDDSAYHGPENDEAGPSPRPEEKMTSYCIRVFKSDGTFATLQMSIDSSVQDLIGQLSKKSYVSGGLEYHIALRKHGLIRVLGSAEKPLFIQKRLLRQVGFEERDRIEDIGREDNSYLCRFLFMSSRELEQQARTQDLGLGRTQKFNHVDLSARNIIRIPIYLYSKVQDIISLNLSKNLSLDLPRDFISSCQNLRDIKFNNNEARKLPASLGRASRLTYLDVSNNRIDHLENAELNGLVGLLKLNLANNRLKHLPPYFGAYRSLRTLNVSSNFLDKFPSFLCELESLVDLDLSFNLIGAFPPAIENLRNLEKLVITNNRLAGTLPDSFSRLQSLRELDIKYNAISGIDVISMLPKLEILAADHNAISQFVGSFERVRSLKLKDNPITRFELTSTVPTLKLLNLSNAKLASIAESFNHMLNLERLVLDRNHFVSLPSQIGRLRRLEHFSIAHNALAELPPEVGCLQELKFLDVRGNNLKKLPLEIWWANKLETLNASSNVMTDFPKPASRPPQPPESIPGSMQGSNGKVALVGSLSTPPSIEDLDPDDSRRPSQASSSTLLSVGPSPVPVGPDRKSSVVSVYGKGGRKTSIISRSANSSGNAPVPPNTRKDSGLSARITNTFSGSLRNLFLADNLLDDDVFDQIMLLCELRVLNLSFNQISDMPQRCIKSWPQLSELYLSGNELTTIPVDDLEEYSLLQVLHINCNKFTNLPADISRAKKLAVLDCGSNFLKYNISNVPYDWNWNLNPNLRYLNLSGNRRLEIKQPAYGSGAGNREQYTDFSRLQNLRVLGLMDVTLTQPSIPEQSEDCRVRTSGSSAGYLPYAMADTLGKNEHLSTVDLVVPRFNASETETLLGLFDGQALSSGGSKIAKYLHENFGQILATELRALKTGLKETPEDALRRAFLALNKELVTIAIQHSEDRPSVPHRSGSQAHVILNKEDLNSGGVATVVYLQGQDLYVANVGDAQAMIIQSDQTHKMLTRKHDPAEPTERSRIREAGGWVSRNGKLNDQLGVSRAFGYVDLMPAVQAAPHVSHVAIREQDEMILLATSELWEHLAPELIVDIARQERGDLMRATQKLRDLAIAYGSTNKIMIMMISVADLKRRTERTRINRGQSMSIHNLSLHGEQYKFPTRGRRKKDQVMDSTLQRLEAEVPAPTGMIAIVFTDIKNSTNLWETYPAAMRSAIRLHNEMMRRQLRRIGGFEVKTEGDAFMVSFPTATSALLWCFAVQLQLLEVNWPSEMLNSLSCKPTVDKNNQVIFKGLSVRMGIHWGEPLCEPDPITRRMDYYGPMVNKASRISAVADGGQITVSSDFISEIQRCLETYQGANAAALLNESFDEDPYSTAIRKELRSLSSQGFEVKELGERKLKGLENPEVVYSLYPHQLAGRIETHQAHDKGVTAAAPEVSENTPAVLKEGSGLDFDPEIIWGLWKLSLRLEMLCSSLEYVGGRGLQPPETELLERMKQRGGEVTEGFLVNFMEHQISRIETCVSTLSIRHLSMGGGTIKELDDLRGPISGILANVGKQMAELQRYKALYGPLDAVEDGQQAS